MLRPRLFRCLALSSAACGTPANLTKRRLMRRRSWCQDRPGVISSFRLRSSDVFLILSGASKLICEIARDRLDDAAGYAPRWSGATQDTSGVCVGVGVGVGGGGGGKAVSR